MNWPQYAQGSLAPLLKTELQKLNPEPTGLFILLDEGARRAVETPVQEALEGISIPVHCKSWEPLDKEKSLSTFETFARHFIRLGVDRNTLVLAIGGGVTTDLGGFLAASLLRGIRWGAIPTTLLGMVDAALGGKTAVNLPEGKNLLGAFHQPEFVLCDVDMLRSLPTREWNCGLGEVLKTALISGADMMRTLERAKAEDLRRPSSDILELAAECGLTKMRIVEEDPLEQGQRKILNLGHTFGHALETAAGHEGLAHGEAVALGLLCAVRLAEEMGVAESDWPQRIRALIKKLELPSRFPGKLPTQEALTALIKRDKKAHSGRLDLVLPVEPGRCLIIRKVEPTVAVGALCRELG